MSRTFTKLFSSITESTVWCEPDRTRLVWIAMLAMADHAGRVWSSVPGLANRARVPLEDVEIALTTFLSPDAYSRTPDHEGRRIEPIDGGWRLLNHAKYRQIRDEESIKESKRRYINERRAAEKAEGVEKCRTASNAVDRGRANAEADTEADTSKAKSKTKADAPSAKRGQRIPADWEPSDADVDFAVQRRVNWREELETFRDFWLSKSGADACKLDWSATWRNWIRRSRQSVKPVPQAPAKSKTLQAVERIGRMVNAVDGQGDWFGTGEAVVSTARRLPGGGHDRGDGGGVD